MGFNGRKPNFLVIMVDEERYPTSYDSQEVKDFCKTYLSAQNAIRSAGMEFHRHYAGATACTPSRATIFTGQYPSLHGVTQTSGLAKSSSDPQMFWLDANSVPTMGDYFRAGGYQTFYKGKWHVSHADISIPGTHDSLQIYNNDGTVIEQNRAIYQKANRLADFGFDGWVGPEPHGAAKVNCGTMCDSGYAQDTVDLLDQLEEEKRKNPSEFKPWLVVTSFVNPHDIVLFGVAYKSFGYPFTDGTVPDIDAPPTQGEDLKTKPSCQQSYVNVYPKMLTPQPTVGTYRQFYYYLQKLADQQMQRIYTKLQNSSFYEDTFVIFTSDHGDLLGAHGGMHQKWYNAYEETIHVPFIISNPQLFKESKSVYMPTSHVDLIPTMLGLAGIDAAKAASVLSQDHSEVHPLVGRDLSSVVLGQQTETEEPVYFMTDDEVSEGLNQTNPLLGFDYHSVVQPGHLETVIAVVKNEGKEQVWKYTRYFDNPQFWNNAPDYDEKEVNGHKVKKNEPRPEEFEMYNVTEDPLEENNLCYASNQTESTKKMQEYMAQLLNEQCKKKRLQPKTGTAAGAPTC